MMTKYLPIGSVVLLKKGLKKVMVTGFCSVEEANKEKIYDYSGCLYPEGILSSNINLLFDHKQIETVIFLGYIDKDYEAFNKNLLNSYE